jgi:hypothetical protein
MAFTQKAPKDWLGSGYSAGTDSVTFSINAPTAALPDVADIEADIDTGDISKLMYGLINGLFENCRDFRELLDATDRPTRFTFSRGTVVDDATGLVMRAFGFTFVLESSGLEVAPEP